MTTSDPAGPGRVDETHSGLQKLYYICFTEPAGSLEDLERHLDEHKAYLVQLERAGLLFAAGPLLDENYRFHGPGMIVLNAASRAQAESIVRADHHQRLQPPQSAHPPRIERNGRLVLAS
jgi:uncharacterized protein YciI